MTGPRARLALAVAVIAVLAGALMLTLARSAPPPPRERPAGERPELMLLTSLPIVFPERLTLDAPASPALQALQSHYRVIPISVTAASELGERTLLLMAQPHAQPAEALVELDSWVRRGGRVLLLADPVLEWPSMRSFADRLRPPVAFADTGLLGHWGVRLEPPAATGPASRQIGAREIRTSSPGKLIATGRNCSTSDDGLIARCQLGYGQATILADADLLNPDATEGATAEANFGLLLDELASLEQ